MLTTTCCFGLGLKLGLDLVSDLVLVSGMPTYVYYFPLSFLLSQSEAGCAVSNSREENQMNAGTTTV